MHMDQCCLCNDLTVMYKLINTVDSRHEETRIKNFQAQLFEKLINMSVCLPYSIEQNSDFLFHKLENLRKSINTGCFSK